MLGLILDIANTYATWSEGEVYIKLRCTLTHIEMDITVRVREQEETQTWNCIWNTL